MEGKSRGKHVKEKKIDVGDVEGPEYELDARWIRSQPKLTRRRFRLALI